MCYLCLEELFRVEIPYGKVEKAKDRALEIKRQLKLVEEGDVVACDDGDKVIASLKEEQYKLSREM
jgi:hypothetical protein